MTSPSSDPTDDEAVEFTNDPEDWEDLWESEPVFEKWSRGGREWR